MAVTLMSDLDLSGRRILIREDLNVPIKNNLVSSDARIQAALPTIRQALSAGAQVIIMSHLGRPDEGTFNPQHSLAPVAKYLSGLLNEEVILINDFQQHIFCCLLRGHFYLYFASFTCLASYHFLS